MKRTLSICTLFLLVCVPAFSIFADARFPKTRVALVPLVNEEKTQRYDSIRGTVYDTLELNLGFVPKFTILAAAGLDPYKKFDQLKEYAARNAVDYVVFGKVGPGGPGKIVLQLSVYDRVKGAITVRREKTVGSIFELFNAANQLVHDVVRGFSGLEIGFGAVQVVNTGEEGDYEVFMDGDSLGKNFKSARRVFNGNRLLEVKQKRMLGEEVVFSGELKIEADAEARVEFAVPYLLPREKALLDRLEGVIWDLEENRNETARVRETFSELLALFRDVSYCRRLAEERERIRQSEVEYRLKAIAWGIEDAFFAPKEETFAEIEEIYDTRGSYQEPARVEAGAIGDFQYLFGVLDLHASFRISEGNWDRAIGYYRYMDRIAQKVPFPDMQEFEKDMRFVSKTWKRYVKKSERNETFAEIMIGVRMGQRFKEKLLNAERFFKNSGEIEDKELIVVTYPPGLNLAIDGDEYGASPLRARRIAAPAVEVSVLDAWYEKESRSIALPESRTYLYLQGRPKGALFLNPAEVTGKERVMLSWSAVQGAVTYRVQVDKADGDFLKPLSDVKGLKENTANLKIQTKKGERYVYRVQAIGGDDSASSWVYSDPFQVR